MSVWSIVLFLLAAVYLLGGIFEFPIVFERNPKSRLLIEAIGKRNFKLMLFVLAAIFIALAVMLR